MDIFGRMPSDYTWVRTLQEDNRWNDYQADIASQRAGALPYHDFNALGAGAPAGLHERATEDMQAMGYLTNNLLAIQTMIDEILYTAYRLPQFVHLNTSLDEGLRTYGVEVHDRVGRAERITAPGYDAPSATVAQSIVTMPVHWYGLDAEWDIDSLRGAMFTGRPLATHSLEAAITGTLETMEYTGLLGGGYPDTYGLLNLPITGTDRVIRTAAAGAWSGRTAVQIRDDISGQLSAVIESSNETVGRNLTQGMSIYLPGEQYDLLTHRYVGDNAERTVMDSILRDNPWTHMTGNQLMIHRVLELNNRGQGNTDRMIVAMRDPRIAEMGVPISPRLLRILDKGRVFCGMVEAKFSPLFVKRPSTIRYLDGI